MALKTVEMVREIRDAVRAETRGLDRRELVAYYSAKAGAPQRSTRAESVRNVRERPQTDA